MLSWIQLRWFLKYVHSWNVDWVTIVFPVNPRSAMSPPKSSSSALAFSCLSGLWLRLFQLPNTRNISYMINTLRRRWSNWLPSFYFLWESSPMRQQSYRVFLLCKVKLQSLYGNGTCNKKSKLLIVLIRLHWDVAWVRQSCKRRLKGDIFLLPWNIWTSFVLS